MKWVLTGVDEHLKDSEAIGRETMIEGNLEAAKKRLMGKRTAKRKNKRSNFKHRPDKTKTANRRAFSSSKSDKIDTDHNPDEASNDADDEAEDVEMEGEDADGKV
jgi:hypothetical protein